jgi:hypothetical protein
MPKTRTIIFVVSSFLFAQIGGHRNGGPIEACRTLVPDHEGMEPLDGASSNYYLEVEPQEDGAIEVVLAGGTFKGDSTSYGFRVRFSVCGNSFKHGTNSERHKT